MSSTLTIPRNTATSGRIGTNEYLYASDTDPTVSGLLYAQGRIISDSTADVNTASSGVAGMYTRGGFEALLSGWFHQNLTVSQAATVGGLLTASAGLTSTVATLTSTSATALNNAGGMATAGPTTGSSATYSGQVEANTLLVDTTSQFNGLLTAYKATVTNQLTANGPAIFNGSTTHNATSLFNGNVTISSGNNLSVGGSATITQVLNLYGSTGNTTLQTDGTGATLLTNASNQNVVIKSDGNLILNGPNSATHATISATAATFNGTTASTSSTTGGIVGAGGLGLAGDINTGGNAYFGASTDSSSVGTGAVVTPGGASFAKTVNIGNGLNVGAATTIGGQLTQTGTSTFNALATFNNNIFNAATTDATGLNQAAISTAGGIFANKSIIGNTNLTIANNAAVGNALTVGNGVTVNSGDVNLVTGSLFAKNATYTGDLNVAGNVTFSGTSKTTQVNTTTTQIEDNIELLNSGPAGTADAGFAIKRYQGANTSNQGDVITDTAFFSGTCGSSGNTTKLINLGTTFANSSYATSSIMANVALLITGGTNMGTVVIVSSYSASTGLATIYDSSLSPQPVPAEGMTLNSACDATSTFSLFARRFIMSIWRETEKRWVDGWSSTNPANNPSALMGGTVDRHCNSLLLDTQLNCNTLLPVTTGGAIQVAGIAVQGTAISGVTTLNGQTVAVPVHVSIGDSDTTGIPVPGTVVGTPYLIQVVADSSGGSACWARAYCPANGTAGVSSDAVAAASGEIVDIYNLSGSRPYIYHRRPRTSGTGALLSYSITVTPISKAP